MSKKKTMLVKIKYNSFEIDEDTILAELSDYCEENFGSDVEVCLPDTDEHYDDDELESEEE